MSTSMPLMNAFNFASPGAACVAAGAPSIILGASTVHIQAWVKLDGANLPPDQKVVTVPNAFTLGVGTAGGSQPLLYPEFLDTAGNRYTFQAGVIPVNEWALLEAVWVQGQALTGYVNGVQVGSVPVGSASLQKPPTSGYQMLIGAASPTTGKFGFSGMIQSVVLSDRFGSPPTWGFVVTPDQVLSNWGGATSETTLQGGASIVQLDQAPSTPYGGFGQPPALTSINQQLPSQTVPGPAFQMVVPSSDPNNYMLLSMTQYWKLLEEITGQPNVETGGSYQYITGITTSESETQTFGVSLGLQAGFDIGIFSSQVNLTLSYSDAVTESIELTEQTIISQSFSINDPPVTTTGAWWQPVTTLSLVQFINNAPPVASTVVDQELTDIVAVTYPSGSSRYVKTGPARQVKEKAKAA